MRRLQFGAGPNQLPAPWENFDAELDIRRPLPFPAESAEVIIAEHVIEHVEFREGLAFLGECLRVLQPFGVLRLAFPDITQPIDCAEYCAHYARHHAATLRPHAADVWRSVLTDWGHKSCWTREAAARVLLAVGFQHVVPQHCGVSRRDLLAGMVDRVPRSETTALEAVK